MSPTVPPISEMTTSAGCAAAPRRMRVLISFVMCGITCTVAPRNSPLRSLRSTRVPDRARAVARVPGQVLVDEALVVAEVEIGLGAVLGDEHLAVLERAHRARVDVQVRVELLRLHAQAARLQQPSERGGDDAFAERGDDAAGDEHVLRRGVAHVLPTKPSRLSQHGGRLDRRPERAALAEEGERGQRTDRAPPPPSREPPHGPET